MGEKPRRPLTKEVPRFGGEPGGEVVGNIVQDGLMEDVDKAQGKAPLAHAPVDTGIGGLPDDEEAREQDEREDTTAVEMRSGGGIDHFNKIKKRLEAEIKEITEAKDAISDAAALNDPQLRARFDDLERQLTDKKTKLEKLERLIRDAQQVK